MRGFVDANVLVSFLLKPDALTPPAAIVRLGFAGAYTLLISRTVVTELQSKIAMKPYLMSRIGPEDVEVFVALLMEAAEIVPEIPEPFPRIGRDRKDDYLIVHALIGRADYLVSGDKDLVSLDGIEGLRIMGPAGFLAVLRDAGRV